MAKISEIFNYGDRNNITPEKLFDMLERAYIDLAIAVNNKPDVVQRSDTSGAGSGDGQATDTFLANGTININLTTDKVEMLTNHTSPTNVTWVTLS